MYLENIDSIDFSILKNLQRNFDVVYRFAKLESIRFYEEPNGTLNIYDKI